MKSMRELLSYLRQNKFKAFKTPESRFLLLTGLKFLSIPLACTTIIFALLYMFVELNYLFFEANGFNQISALKSAFYDYIGEDFINYLPFYSMILFAFFVEGVYMGSVMLRPFQAIAKHTEDRREGFRSIYDPENFSDFRMLTRFCEYFFTSIEDQIKEGRLKPKEVPPQFTRIHAPKFDNGFFLNFFLLIVLSVSVFSIFTFHAASQVHESILDLALKSLETNSKVNLSVFFRGQVPIVNIIVGIVLFFNSLMFIILGANLYKSVSGGSFGIFATLRSFIKGNQNARIHLVGYAHLRNYTRMINKYLTHLQVSYGDQKLIEDEEGNIENLNQRKSL